MAGTTPIYALRYPSLGDSPNSPDQVLHLAEDVEAQIARMDTIPLIQVFLTNGSFSKASNARYVEAELQGAGGGGGGCPSGTGQGSGGGGGGGAWALKRWAASALGSSIPVAVGAGGVGGAFNAPTGGTGGTTSFNGVSCTGGTGGIQGSSTSGTTASGGGQGGTATGGDVNVPGGAGKHGRIFNGLTIGTEHGGDARLGFGGQARLSVGGGLMGGGFGSGAGGCLTTNTNATGGTGSPGIAIIRTWF